MTRKVLALLLSVMMVITMVPFTVLADETGETVTTVQANFVYGESSFTETLTVGQTVKMPELPSDAVIPEGKIMAGWLAGGVRYYVGAQYSVTEAMTEFTAEFIDRNSFQFGLKGNYPSGSNAISDFEPPYGGGGGKPNYSIKGISYAVTTFDGQAVKSIQKTGDTITASRTIDGETQTNASYQLNLYHYDLAKDNYNLPIGLNDASYITVEYYYDTTNRDTEDANGAELAGKVMKFGNYNYYNGGTKTSKSWWANARKPIVANSWQKAVIPVINAVSAADAYLFAEENNEKYFLGQWLIYPFGQTGGQQMYKGDVFYIKSIEFTSYDPENPPAAEREVAVYATSEDAAADTNAIAKFTGLYDLSSVTLPTVVNQGETVEVVEGVKYVYLDDYKETLGVKKFGSWGRVGYDATYANGASFWLNDLDDATFYLNLYGPTEIKFNYNDTYSSISAFEGDTIVLPDVVKAPEGQRFAGWQDSVTSTVYGAGADYTITNTEVYFDAVFASPVEVTFTYGDKSFTESWFVGDRVALPELPADASLAEGEVFSGWMVGDAKRSAGFSYKFDGAVTSINAVYATPVTVYYASTGAIEGVEDTVYTTLAEADAAIAAAGGVGIIKVSGDLHPAGTTLTSTDIKIVGYDENAVFSQGTSSITLTGSARTKLYIDDITVVRSDYSNDEEWFALVNVDLAFGPGCAYKQGTRTNGQKMNLYVAKGKNNSVTVDGAVTLAVLSPLGGWSAGSHSNTGDYKYVVNGGNVSNIFLVARNGNGNGTSSTVTGNVDVEINGGTVSRLVVGSHKADILKGDAVVTINGGNIPTILFGNEGAYANASVGSIKNVALVYNIKEVLVGGYAVTNITESQYTNKYVNSAIIINNAELAETVPYAAGAEYNVQVYGGKATPIFNDLSVLYNIVSDYEEKTVVFANGEKLEAVADDTYLLPAGTVKIQFAKEGEEAYTVSYKNGDTVIEEIYFSGDAVRVEDAGFTKDGAIFDGYAYGDNKYEYGDTFTMPAEDVVLEATWFVNEQNVYYVSAINGDDSFGGHKATKPFATVKKAYASIGSKNGTIVIVDEFTGWFTPNESSTVTLAEGQHVKVTGKDPYTGEIYDAKRYRPAGNGRPQITKGHLEIEYITDINNKSFKNSNGETVKPQSNTPYVVKNSAELTLGTGYDYWYDSDMNGAIGSGEKPGAQIETGDATAPKINVDGKVQFVTLLDWGTANISGDFVVNVGPNANFTSRGVVLGGDAGESRTVTISGNTFVTVDRTKSSHTVALSGFKSVVSTVLNGYQFLLKDTTMTVSEKSGSAGTFTNNGPAYVVTTGALPEGADVVSTTFGKVLVTVPAEKYAIVVSEVQTVELSETTEITLDEGNTSITFVDTLDRVTVKYENGTEEVLFAGTPYKLPVGENTEDKVFYGWTVDGTYMPAGTIITLPSEDGAVVNLAPYYLDGQKTIYYSSVNGDDLNSGLTADEALASLAEVATRFAYLGNDGVTLYIVDEINATSFTLPKYDGVLTVEGGMIVSAQGFSLAGDTIFKNVALKTTTAYKHIVFNGHDVTFAEGVTKAEGSEGILVHAGRQNADMTGDQKIVLTSGIIDHLMVGPYYVTVSSRNWTGNLDIVVDGGKVPTIGFGDGYTGVNGKITVDGNVTITVKSGEFAKFDAGYCTAITGDVAIIDYTDYNTEVVNRKAEDGALPIYVFNMREGINADSFTNGVLTIDKEAKLVGGDAIATGTEFAVETIGTYDVLNTPIFTAEGAQIRLYVDETKPSALRFVAKVYGVSVDDKANFGMLVYPTDLLGEATLTHELVGEKKAKAVEAKNTFAHDGTGFTYTAAITGIADTVEGYQKKFTVVPYYKNADGEYVYLEAMNYSLYDIASVATGEDAESDYIKGIINAVNPPADENETPEAPIE